MDVFRSGSVPRHAAEIPDVGWDAIFPEHGVCGAESAHSSIANPGDAHDLAFVIDRRGG
jgi:hypothetical protein